MSLDTSECRLTPWLELPQMDTGAPRPAVYSDENRLLCAYYISERVVPANTVAVVRFEGVLQFRFGYPNDEALHGHPLAKAGLEPYTAYVVENSPLITEIENQNLVHHSFKPGMYKEHFRHWIISFHDETLEVVASRATVAGESRLTPARAVVPD